MGKDYTHKQYVNISGFNIHQSNRGNAALSYGAVAFLKQKGLLRSGQEIVYFHKFNNPFKLDNLRTKTEEILIDREIWTYRIIPVFSLEKWLAWHLGIYISITPFGKAVKQVALEAADYGGDGFSDIYGDKGFRNRMNQTYLLWKANVPLVMLPQTIGPFAKKRNFNFAVKILRHAKEIYVRDGKFLPELEKLGLAYTQTKDISSYMQPDPWDIKIRSKAIGLNVSGLMYFNTFHGLAGQFEAYPELVEQIINHFRRKNCSVYLIPHSYTYRKPDDNDDMVACRLAYNRLEDKSNVVLVDKDMTAPQVKYVISKMSFFIGARMHANFAAIYTGVPVFGTAYSYKFQGAFDANGLNGKEQTEMVNNLKVDQIDYYIKKIDVFYTKSIRNIKD